MDLKLISGGVAWDWVNEKLYWTDSTYKNIEVYEPSSSYRKAIVTSLNTSNPMDIAVDPGTR